MPQIELKHSDDIVLNYHQIFLDIETTINHLDPSAAECKSRAYAINDYLHTHVFLSIQVLKKPHRDAAFMQTLLNKIDQLISGVLPAGCFYSIALDFLPENYVTAKIDS